MTIRAQTRVVNAQKPAPRWALERVALINKHQQFALQAAEQRRRDVEATRRSAEAAGAERARQEMAEWALRDSDFRKHFFRAAAECLSPAVGDHVASWLSCEIDPLLAQRKKLADAALSKLSISADIRTDGAFIEPALVIRVAFPRPEQFCFIADIGARAW